MLYRRMQTKLENKYLKMRRNKRDGFKLARYFGVPIYFNQDTNEIEARTDFHEILLEIALWVDINIIGVTAFKITLEE